VKAFIDKINIEIMISSILQILHFMLTYLTFIPVSVSSYLVFLPFVKSVDLFRAVMIKNDTIISIGWESFAILSINAVIYFSLDLFVFLICERIAMKKVH